MRSIVIAYENAYCEALHGLIKRLRMDQGLPGLILESRTVRGTGGFVNQVPKLLRTPLKQTKRPPDLLVCLADADAPQNLVPSASAAPAAADNSALELWALEFEKSWFDYLVQKSPVPADSTERLRVICLRWNKESLFLASPDALLDYAFKYEQHAGVKKLLEACVPCPTTLPDQDFILRYRTPAACMNAVFQGIHARTYKKGLHDEDLLRDHISPDEGRRAQVLTRCPDLGRLLRELH